MQIIKIPKTVMNDVVQDIISYSSFVRSLGHEYLHVIQKSGDNVISNHDEREFLAYVYSLTAKNLPSLDAEDKDFFKGQIQKYYGLLPDKKKKELVNVYEDALKY